MKRESEYRYKELANILRIQILSGYIKPGEFLLSENDLGEKYGVSRTSVRKSLHELLGEGLIVKMAGKGTIVPPNLKLSKDEQHSLVVAIPYPSAFFKNGIPILMQMFQQRYPGVHLKVLPFPNVEEIRNLGVDIDLLILSDSMIRHVNLEDYYVLNDWFSPKLEIPEILLRAFSIDRQLWAVPLTFSPIFLAYNPDIFNQNGVALPKPGWTNGEFLQAAKQLTTDTDGDGLMNQYGFAMSTSIMRWPVFAYKQGVRFAPTENMDDNMDRLVRTLAFIQNMVYKEGACPAFALSNHEFAQELFEEGKLGMILTSLFALSNTELSFSPKVSPFPDDDTSAGWMIANGIMINKHSRHTELANMFVQFLLDSDVQKALAQQTRLLSVYPSINRQEKDPEELHVLQLGGDQLDGYLFTHEIVHYDLLQEINEELKMYWAGMEAPQSVAQRLRSMIQDNN